MMNYAYPVLLTLLVLQCQDEPITRPDQAAEEYVVTGAVKFGQELTLKRLEQVTVYGGKAPR